MATSRRVGNYATSAKAVVNASDQIFDAAMSGRPDFTAISKEAIKGRSLERRTAMEAEGQVAKAGINALNKVKQTKIKVDAAKEVADIKRPARRMAGILGGLGTLATTGAMMVQDKRDKAEEAEARIAADARYAEQDRKLTELLQRGKSGSTETIEPFVAEPFPEFKPSRSSGGGGGGSTEPMQLSSGGEGYADRQAVYTYLTKTKGLSHNKAYGLMSNIDRESSFKLNNPGDAGNSNGLFQWNGPRLSAMQKAVPDWQTNWQGQIDYALSEPGEASGQTYLNTTWNSPQEAAEYWTRKWERPAHPDRDVVTNNRFISSYTFK